MKKKNQKLLEEQFVKRSVLKYLEKHGFGDPKKENYGFKRKRRRY